MLYTVFRIASYKKYLSLPIIKTSFLIPNFSFLIHYAYECIPERK